MTIEPEVPRMPARKPVVSGLTRRAVVGEQVAVEPAAPFDGGVDDEHEQDHDAEEQGEPQEAEEHQRPGARSLLRPAGDRPGDRRGRSVVATLISRPA